MLTQRILFVSIALIFSAATTNAAEKRRLASYERLQLTDVFFAEGADSGDFNRDGVMDVVAGPYWYAGPDFTERVEYYAGKPYDINGYSDNFFAFVHDVDEDGWDDIVIAGFPGKEARWYHNPAGKSGHWPAHVAFPIVDNESPTFADVTGDGRPELVFHTDGRLGFAQINADDPTQPWQFQAISEPRDYQRFTHGLGVGDVNGDGRTDLLMKEGWWEQPPQLDPQQLWPFHPVAFTDFGGAQMLVTDVDGDGDNDVITSKHAHGYGLAWFEQVRENGSIEFREHLIMGERPEESPHGVAFSQLHALALADMNDDGVDDIVTGKRYWAHQGHDVGGHDPAVLYFFLTIREDQQVRFEPHQIDNNSGVGTQVVAKDLNKDGVPDIVVGNKKGAFVHLSRSRETGQSSALGVDEYPYAGISAEEAAAAMSLPDGFTATVFAAEPDVKQPIAMALDDRGRVWIAEAHEYPRRAPEGEGRDRILVFEDVDGDGKFDKRTVFAENLNLVSGLEVGFGGVWVGAAPYFLFIPDANGDDRPDGPPQVLLDGWGYEDTHETLNAFIWGPDGWLYGCHGVFTHSKVGKPGTPDDQRTPLNAGVWRYHPTRHEFEVFAHGTSNPWGVDFNDLGQTFITACVIPHLYHMTQGGRYQRQGGVHFNPYTYDDIKTIADHQHYAGNIADHAWWGRDKPAEDHSTDAAGGGHAHAGAMIYLGGSWPEEYRSQIFMNNIHGARLNRDQLTPHGSGYIGSHRTDFLLSHDRASQIINLRYGPDGQVMLIDWYDMQQCHRGDPSAHDRSNGRIFRVAYEGARSVQVDLKQLTNEQLVELQLHKNDWYVRHARRILQERAAGNAIDGGTHQSLAEMAIAHPDETRRLRGLWALAVTGGLTEEVIADGLANDSPYVRAWTIQLAAEQKQPSPETIAKYAHMAADDSSQVVRLYLAAALQRLPLELRWEILAGLLSHAEDASDQNLPLILWYAMEPLAESDSRRAMKLASESQIPLLRSFTLRRIADIGSPEAIDMLIESLGASATAAEQVTFLESINTALKGRRSFPMPSGWPDVYKNLLTSSDGTVLGHARVLAVRFGDRSAIAEMRAIAANENADPAHRRAALASLLGANDSALPRLLQSLIADKRVRRDAIRGLAAFADPTTPGAILGEYASFDADEKRDAVATLASRTEYAAKMLDAIDAGTIAASDLSADIVRQLNNLGDRAVAQRIADVWGIVRETPAEKQQQIAFYRQMITGDGAPVDVSLGRAVYAKTCQQCHKMFGAGESIGPELTGSNRANLDYLLSNVIDPSAVMAKEYQSSVIVTDAGRVITGIVQQQNKHAVTIITATETVTIPRDEIEEIVPSEVSMMPDNQLKNMSDHEIRSLVAYLARPRQVPMLATSDNATTLFNGRDLKGWSGNMEVWSVQNGEIVGTSQGLKENQFLASDLVVGDFELTLRVKLTPDAGNSGVQFRTEMLSATHAKGYQADIGTGWWGALYEEAGRAVLSKPVDPGLVKLDQWNDYRIVAVGDHVRTYINGHACVDLHDEEGAQRGVIALQVHAGDPMEVRFKDILLKVDLPPNE